MAEIQKIYYFDPDNKNALTKYGYHCQLPGVDLPPNSTLIPPPSFKTGQIPTFNSKNQQWEIIQDFIPRTKFISLDATYEFNITHKPDDPPIILPIDHPDNVGGKTVQAIYSHLLSLEKFDRYISPFSIALKTAFRINSINKNLLNLYSNHNNLYNSSPRQHCLSIDQIEFINTSVIDIIHNIKKLLDTFVIAAYFKIIDKSTIYQKQRRSSANGIEFLLARNTPPNQDKLRQLLNFDHFVDFLSVINNCHNAFKHDIMTEELIFHIESTPHIFARKFDRDNLKTLYEYNIELHKIIYACNDFLSDLLFHNHTKLPTFKLITTNIKYI